MAQIDIRAVRKSYGQTEVVHGVDLHIQDGEFVVILGPSGCGKSTLLRMIAGLENITDGEIAIDGTVVNELEPRHRGCAMVFQNYALYPHMTVAGNIGYALKVEGLPKADRDARVLEVARSLELEPFLDRKPGQLSGGQRQRVAMGRAMIREPKVFLFDEPLSILDAKLRVAMRLEIRRLHQRLDATSVFVTHDQIEAMTLADRLVVMNQGNIDQVGTPTEIYDVPASAYVAGFIGAPPMNLLAGEIAQDGGHVVLADGQTAPLPAGWRRAEPGQKVQFGVRPEALSFVPVAGAVALTMVLDFQEELGMGRLFHGRMGAEELIVHATEKTAPVPFGETVQVYLMPETVHLFDAQTGHRLGAEAPIPVAAQ
ncbi:MAG: sn-glycerol-3-phosphate ABC transporter ATP-binding protein UgpC [Pseudomonadota bacterium]